MQKLFLLFAMGAMMLSFTGCQSDTPESSTTVSIEETAEEWKPEHTQYTKIPLDSRAYEVAISNNKMALDILKEMAKSERLTENNIVFSPFSIYNFLAMLANASDPIAQDEILDVLSNGASHLTIDRINDYCSMMNEWLPKVDGQCNLRIGNSIWIDKRYQINPTTEKMLSEIFSADIFNNVIINSEEAKSAINEWHRSQTSGMIEDLLKERLDDSYAVFLTNALYFRGCWQSQFNKNNNTTAKFHGLHGDIDATFMNQKITLESSKYDSFRCVSIPYGNRNYQMKIVMPNKESDIYKFADTFSEEYINHPDVDKESITYNLYLPKFNAEIDFVCNDALKNIGVEKVFFLGLSKLIVGWIDSVKDIHQLTKISVDEEGTAAAAVTYAITDGSNQFDNEEVQELKIDSPFLYLIEETSTGTILFEGIVTNPQ